MTDVPSHPQPPSLISPHLPPPTPPLRPLHLPSPLLPSLCSFLELVFIPRFFEDISAVDFGFELDRKKDGAWVVVVAVVVVALSVGECGWEWEGLGGATMT